MSLPNKKHIKDLTATEILQEQLRDALDINKKITSERDEALKKLRKEQTEKNEFKNTAEMLRETNNRLFQKTDFTLEKEKDNSDINTIVNKYKERKKR